MLHLTFLFLEQLWQLFEVSQILEFLRYSADIIESSWVLSIERHRGRVVRATRL